MKKKLLIILGLVAIFIAFVLLRFFIFDRPTETGRIKILSSPTAGVFIDNVAVGKTSYEARIAPGEHMIKLIPEGETDISSWEGKVPVYQNTLTFISRELATSELTSAGEILTITKMDKNPKDEIGMITVITDPVGAIVFLDNDEKGIAPLTLKDVPAGEHELAVYLPGFFRRSQKIKVSKGSIVQSDFKLALDKTHKTLDEEIKNIEEKNATDESRIAEGASDENTNTDSEVKSDTNSGSLTVKDTPVGYLNVRKEPSTSGEKIAQVNPDEKYDYSEVENSWYKIKLDDGTEGWVSGDYITIN